MDENTHRSSLHQTEAIKGLKSEAVEKEPSLCDRVMHIRGKMHTIPELLVLVEEWLSKPSVRGSTGQNPIGYELYDAINGVEVQADLFYDCSTHGVVVMWANVATCMLRAAWNDCSLVERVSHNCPF